MSFTIELEALKHMCLNLVTLATHIEVKNDLSVRKELIKSVDVLTSNINRYISTTEVIQRIRIENKKLKLNKTTDQLGRIKYLINELYNYIEELPFNRDCMCNNLSFLYRHPIGSATYKNRNSGYETKLVPTHLDSKCVLREICNSRYHKNFECRLLLTSDGSMFWSQDGLDNNLVSFYTFSLSIPDMVSSTCRRICKYIKYWDWETGLVQSMKRIMCKIQQGVCDSNENRCISNATGICKDVVSIITSYIHHSFIDTTSKFLNRDSRNIEKYIDPIYIWSEGEDVINPVIFKNEQCVFKTTIGRGQCLVLTESGKIMWSDNTNDGSNIIYVTDYKKNIPPTVSMILSEICINVNAWYSRDEVIESIISIIHSI